jgi:photosystem II stability/assembly factor-like uncharacterized protein
MRFLFTVLFFISFLSGCSSNKQDYPGNYRADVLNANWMTGEFLSKQGIFILAGEQGSILVSADGQQWSQSQTPVTHTLHDIESDDSQTVLIAVGEGGTIIRSTNQGREWHKTDINLPDNLDFSLTQLNTVIYSHKDQIWLAAGTQNSILRSSDNGLTWKLVSYNSNTDQLEILQLFIENTSNDLLFAAQHSTTGRSRDGGLNWEITQHDMNASDSYIPHVVGFHQFNNTLIAAADNGWLLISNDAGQGWKYIAIPTAGYFTDGAYDPNTETIALTTQMGEVAISKDEGHSWELVSFSVKNWPSNDIPLLSRIVYDDISRSFLVVGNSGVIARSSDGGQSWHADIYKPLLNLSVTTLLHDTGNSTFVVAGYAGAIAKANALGSTFNPIDKWITVSPGIDQYIRKVMHLPGTSTFIAVGQLGSVWRSEDDGRSWKYINIEYPYQNQPPHLRDILQDPDSLDLIAAGPSGSIIHSSDNGMNWKPVFQGKIQKGEAFTQLLYDSNSKKYYACEVLYQSVYQSPDKGLSWNKISTIDSDGRNLWQGVFSDKLNLLLVVGEKGAIAFSRDGGYNWKMAETDTYSDLYGVYVDPNQTLFLTVGENGVVLRSENGADWQAVDSSVTSTLRRVISGPDNGSIIAFGQDGTIIRSTDGGVNWTKTKTPEYSGELRLAFNDKRSNHLIIVGQEGGVLRSKDSGKSWQIIDSHTKQHFRTADINPKTGTIICAGEGIVRLSEAAN